jgi:hypothetical protein
MMRKGRLGLWLVVALTISALGSASAASRARWEVTVHVAPAGIELAATTEHARFAVKL